MRCYHHFTLTLILYLLAGILPVAANQNTLLNVQFSTLNHHERVTLEFREILQQEPVLNFEEGFFSLRLSDVDIRTGLSSLITPEANPLIKFIRITQGSAALLMEIVLIPPRVTPEGKYRMIRDKNTLSIDLDRVALLKSQPLSPVDKNFESEMAQKAMNGRLPETFTLEEGVPSESSPISESSFSTSPEENWISTMLVLILALLVILMLIYLLAYGYNRFLSGKLPKLQSRFPVKIISSFYVGPKQKIVVLEINNQYFACGITPNAINFLTEVRSKEDQAFLNQVDVKDGNISFNETQARAEFLSVLQQARQKSKIIESAEKQTTPNPSLPPKPRKKTQAPPQSQPEPPGNASRQTVAEVSATEDSEESAMSDFSQKLAQKLKSLKPLN
ncbi:MAG: flagellar biosynthetic protein FliO [SAR324 cluster bacterium]|nr:flagellar biosynthetic protein FliO [SAR324 cluster bacterium]